MHLRVLTQDLIVLNSYEAIRDLLEHRSHNYSDRPHIPANDMWVVNVNFIGGCVLMSVPPRVDFNWGTGFLPYGDEWRVHRKLFHQAFRPETITSYQAMQLMKVRDLLKNMCDSPADFERHFRSFVFDIIGSLITKRMSRFSTAISMAATYDYHPAPRNDPMVGNLKVLAEVAVSLLGPTQSTLFAAFPFCESKHGLERTRS